MYQLRQLWQQEEGQDLTEYVLLLAFIALTTAALIIPPANSVNQIWSAGNVTMSSAAVAAAS